MPSTPRPTRAAAAKCSAKLDHHAAKTKNRRVRRHERRIIAKDTRAKQVQKQLLAEAPPTMVPVAGFVADCVWSKLNGADNFFDMLHALCQDGAEDQVETKFYFQHPDARVARGMVALVDDTADEDGECGFPEVFTPALEDIDKASEFTLSGTGSGVWNPLLSGTCTAEAKRRWWFPMTPRATASFTRPRATRDN